MSLQAPTTFLDLVQRLGVECGVSGAGGPTTTVGQTGEMQRLVMWTVQAWIDIQALHRDWQFLRTSTTWPTVSGQANYTLAQCNIPAGTFGLWQRETFRNYVTASGLNSEVFMSYREYDAWRNTYFYGALRNTLSRPMEASIGPDKSIWLGPVPAVGYTMEADYFTAPVTLANDADVPTLPPEQILIIVYKAMMAYALYQAAPEVYQRAEMEYSKILRRMEADRLPELTFAGTLA